MLLIVMQRLDVGIFKHQSKSLIFVVDGDKKCIVTIGNEK